MTTTPESATPIELSMTQGIATLTLNRPEARNAISDDMRTLLIEHLERIAADNEIKALILTGMQARMSAPAGSVAFNGWKRQQRVHHAVSLLHNLPKPTLAAVNGAATGLGCDMALSCDFIIASEQASFAMSYIARGLIPDGGGLYFLPRRVGLSRAKELIFSGRTVSPSEAERIHMIDRVVPHDDLLPAAQDWALQLSAGSATALGLSKSILNNTFELTQGQISAMGSQAQGICYTSSEHQESVAAFLARKSNGGQR